MMGESPQWGVKALGDLAITKKLMKSYREQDAITESSKYTAFWDPGIVHDYLITISFDHWDQPLTTKILTYLLKEGLSARSSDVARLDFSSLGPSVEPSKYFKVDIRLPKDTASRNIVIKRRRLYLNYSSSDPRLLWTAVLQ